MEREFGGRAFNLGETHFSLWEGEEVKGTLAVITKDVDWSGEVFVSNIYVRERAEFKLLLENAMNYCSNLKPKGIKLGIYPSQSYLIPTIEEYGFTKVYKAVVLKHRESKRSIEKCVSGDIKLTNFSNAYKREFQGIVNRAFVNSPNAGRMTSEELNELIEKCKQNPGLAGICLYNGNPAGVYELSIVSNVGWIKAIAVDPIYQGIGIGKILLEKSVRTLYASGCKEVKLVVISTNEKAVNLYSKYGFEEDTVRSIWFMRPCTTYNLSVG
ncbi:MAG: GNAT family N-acetyltransferase [Peptococcaceae bacterium]|nr:GNAT family N-acetyltransferase [Peptococcaceae bacterium]